VRYANRAMVQTVTGRSQTAELAGADLPLGRGAEERGPDLVALAMAAVSAPAAPPASAAATPAPPALPAPAAPAPVAVASEPAMGVSSVAVRLVPAGTYEVGCTAGQTGCENDEKPIHAVTLTRDLLVMETEVSQGLWESVMNTRPWEKQMIVGLKGQQESCARAGVGPSLPLYCIGWRDAARLANALSERDRLEACYVFAGTETMWPKGVTCAGWRLPTEAEWEVAARGGGDPLYAGEGPVGALAWTSGSAGGARPVKETLPNGYGLYDMSGNVSEWVWDWYGPYAPDASVDPVGPSSGYSRVHRGGSWRHDITHARVADRDSQAPNYIKSSLGVRLVRTAP
jgi:formylglycine-generating enzyme required for sulfatase activity